eukprot:CAMPEP_0201194670 /NCGR_PEP_ID=MMETSP0851-20130426/149538_1 /ASSEMBLY_ACC=CAM_ASM_000631 /TAXON_ID=183588 /ORGANISM="Pseudo-nitzschia fraudulenta, Strain WWA7" /LENGTH=657 /DNA_ID=CAMNT_0047481377 /DNA_START=16 /DNA_END=1989 /DNA_ORIENTATION=+
MAATSIVQWAKGPEAVSLYSDWKVSFTTDYSVCKDAKELDSSSVSTRSMSSSGDSISSDEESSTCENSKDKNEQKKPTMFSIHRNMIGPKSAFFTKSFLADDGASKSTSRISLPSSLSPHAFTMVVEAFEVILDYCYTGIFVPEDKLTTANSVAMFCLSNYFGMDPDVTMKVRDFIKSNLTQDTVAQYYQVVIDLRCQEYNVTDVSSSKKNVPILDANPIMDMVVSLCHRCPFVLHKKGDLFKIADLSLWLSIGSLLANDDRNGESFVEDADEAASKVWSENLTAFIDNYHEADIVDLKDSFRTLTAENILPVVSFKVALRLLEHERALGLEKVATEYKKDEEMTDTGVPSSASVVLDDATCFIDSNYDSDLDNVTEEVAVDGMPTITNLQKRCIKALCESNWAGEENDVESKRGKLVSITTPAVLEALLIESVIGERSLTSKMNETQAAIDTERKSLAKEKETCDWKAEQSRVEVAKEKQKQQALDKKMKELTAKLEIAERKAKAMESKMELEKKKLCKANAIIEADLEKEKKKSHGLLKRLRAMELAQNRTESDREMYELSVKETIKRLETIITIDDSWSACGMGPLILILSALGDRQECEQIKDMLQSVLKEPMSYERDYLLKNKSYDDRSCEFKSSDDETVGTKGTLESKPTH